MIPSDQLQVLVYECTDGDDQWMEVIISSGPLGVYLNVYDLDDPDPEGPLIEYVGSYADMSPLGLADLNSEPYEPIIFEQMPEEFQDFVLNTPVTHWSWH